MKYLRKYSTTVIILGLIVWAYLGTGIKLSNIIKGIPFAIDYLWSMFPPSLEHLHILIPLLFETIQIAVIAISVSSVFSIFFAFFTAKNINESKLSYSIFRTIVNILRSLPALIYALIFVAMVGLGPLPGILGLICHNIGALTKYFSEAIENINPELLLAIKSTGANKIQQIRYAVIPELKPLFIGYILYYFESNVRSATILGLVGAGGIGFKLTQAIRLFQHREIPTILILIILAVIIIDTISSIIRNKVINE